MVVRCEDVWREVSNYLDGELDPQLRAAVEEHVRGCRQCTAVVNGTRNVVELYGDERMLQIPLGFSRRLQQRLGQGVGRSPGTAFGWMMALGFAALLLITFEVGNSNRSLAELRSEMARTSAHIPPELVVVAETDGRIFHVPGCRFILDKDHLKTMTSAEALRLGYAPCVRCLRKYLAETHDLKTEDETAGLETGEPEQ